MAIFNKRKQVKSKDAAMAELLKAIKNSHQFDDLTRAVNEEGVTYSEPREKEIEKPMYKAVRSSTFEHQMDSIKKLPMNEKINRMLDIIAEPERKKAKKKSFDLPAKYRTAAKSFIKNNKILVLYLKLGKGIEPVIGQIQDGMVRVNDIDHSADPDAIWLWKGKIPTMIIPEWDLQPIGGNPKPLTVPELYADAEKNQRLNHPQRIIIRAIQGAQLAASKKMGGRAMIWIIIGGIAVVYLLFGGA